MYVDSLARLRTINSLTDRFSWGARPFRRVVKKRPMASDLEVAILERDAAIEQAVSAMVKSQNLSAELKRVHAKLKTMQQEKSRYV